MSFIVIITHDRLFANKTIRLIDERSNMKPIIFKQNREMT